ncbi:MAG TPA: hypothetical protein VKA89_00695 [Solirubrobacterales bacterium]|nr:hypothetical protein [Solirubrobacterales bacterium]
MSQANVDVVQAAFAAFIRGDTDAVLQLCAEDIEITQPPGASFAVREGKIAEWRIFVSEDQALEAAGLRG